MPCGIVRQRDIPWLLIPCMAHIKSDDNLLLCDTFINAATNTQSLNIHIISSVVYRHSTIRMSEMYQIIVHDLLCTVLNVLCSISYPSYFFPVKLFCNILDHRHTTVFERLASVI